ncbi:uncharacterized protein LOC141860747 [Acropora palmata]|uniref:uncharacterized protein LOC141860747 n=1 Tax=Acropora palmata TaxID=6131 RepID=UPI003DA1C712
MAKKEKIRRDVETVNQSGDLFSCLFAVMNSGKFWRCVRWCDEGGTVLITSPVLFQKQVLKGAEWKEQLKIKDFDSFVDLLQQTGFKEVLNQRSSKVRKFRHPDFWKGSENVLSIGEHEERENAKRKRKAKEQDNAGSSGGVAVREENYFNDLEKKAKRHRAAVLEDNNTRTKSKRKRSPGNRKLLTHSKRQKTAVQRAPNDPIADKTPSQQLCTTYSEDEKTTAHTLLNLSAPVIFANYYTNMELIASQSLFHFFKLLQERSIEELDAACALLRFSVSA